MSIGLIVGALIGFMMFGWFGAILGALVGHYFSRGLRQAMGFDPGADRERIEKVFFETAFTLMGALAKADGRVSEAEIAQAEQAMARMGLTSEHRREAIELFKRGAVPEFDIEPQIATFKSDCGRHLNLRLLLLEYLLAIALADGELHGAEREILLRVAEYLGIRRAQFEQLLAMLLAQQRFHHEGTARPEAARADELAAAYRALGVSEDASDRDVKKAYRKLMSQHHPDKLIAQGVPEDMVQMATEKSQEIRAAYETVKKARDRGA